jgi:hypothetical protein
VDANLALVLVGRRGRLRDNAGVVRQSYREQGQIRIHTYDWFIERLLGILAYAGPSRSSPDVLRPLRERTDPLGDADTIR